MTAVWLRVEDPFPGKFAPLICVRVARGVKNLFMWKVCFPIASVLGLACGLTLREFKPLEEKEAVAARDIKEPAIQKDVRLNEQAIGPGWGLDGTLSLEVIQDLPVGGRRAAELVLWMAAASPAEWGARWDELEAALDWALQDEWDESGAAVPVFLERIPETFAARVEELPTGSRKVALLVQRAAWLARSDPGLAVELARKEGRRPRGLMLDAVASQLAGTNHELMSGFFMTGRRFCEFGPIGRPECRKRPGIPWEPPC